MLAEGLVRLKAKRPSKVVLVALSEECRNTEPSSLLARCDLCSPALSALLSMAFRIVRDAGGVLGLHVAYNVFSEEAEQRLFAIHAEDSRERLHAEKPTDFFNDDREGGRGAERFPDEWFQVINAVRDCGLAPDLVMPQCCISWSYPPGAVFPFHWDSRFRWGEYVLGVSLGAPARITFQPNIKPNVKPKAALSVQLPRRSIYVMTDQSRTAYQHSVDCVKQVDAGDAVPFWNPEGMRRALTFRTTKTYNYVALQHQVTACERLPESMERTARITALRARMAAQRIETGAQTEINWPEQHCSRDPNKKGKLKWYTKEEQDAAAERAHCLLRAFETEPGMAHEEHALAAKVRMRLPARDALFLRDVPATTRELYDAAMPVPEALGPMPPGGDDDAGLAQGLAMSAAMAAAQEQELQRNGDDGATLAHVLAMSRMAAAEDAELRQVLDASGWMSRKCRRYGESDGAGPSDMVVDLTDD